MVYVALALAACLVVTVTVFAGLVRSVQRDAARERAQNALERERLVDQVCHLAGNPWTLPPTADRRPYDPGVPDPWVVDPEHAEVT